jgi:hypothetical protein
LDHHAARNHVATITNDEKVTLIIPPVAQLPVRFESWVWSKVTEWR